MGKITLQMRQPKKSVNGVSASRAVGAGTRATAKQKNVKPTKPINLYPTLADLIHLMPQESASERANRELQEYVLGRALTPASGPSISDSELVSGIRGVMQTVSQGATVSHEQGRINITISGLTAELLSGSRGGLGVHVSPTGNAEVFAEQETDSGNIRLSATFDDPFQFEVSHDDIRFVTKVNQDRWEMSLSIGQAVPSLSQLPEIFREGDSSLRSVIRAGSELDIDNIDATKSAIEPHIEPLGRAIRAVDKIYRAESRWSVGINASGPMSNRDDMPTAVSAVFTFQF